MMWAIVARFLLGTYTGHRDDGAPDPFPDPARLHAALVHAACQGSTALADSGGSLRPSPESLAALRWFESNPPTGIHLPESVPINGERVIAYRHEGVVRKEGAAWTDKKTQRRVADGYAFNGEIAWVWEQEPPADVRDTLDALCADVSCLGEAASPVVLEVSSAAPEQTLRLRPEASRFAAGATAVRVAEPGRVDALLTGHQKANVKRPTTAQDRPASSELPAPHPVVTTGLASAQYFPADPAPAAGPWQEVILLPVDLDVDFRDRVLWCTALHRALVSRIGFGAPSLVTGVYEPGVPRPANRLALQYLHRSLLGHLNITSDAFALMIPAGAEQEDYAALTAALANFRYLRSPAGMVQFDGTVHSVLADEFWPAPAPRTVRMWTTNPVAVAETRPQRDAVPAWTLQDAALLSVGFVLRDRWQLEPGRGLAFYRSVVEQARERGVRVQQVRAVAKRDAERYVHKLHRNTPVLTYSATFDVGEAIPPRTLSAVGQSRHLGGGLLVPVDHPEDLANALREVQG
ncbi:type I-U CRISPR-associated protein Cas5/Cas6 [Rhodococcus triatomae]|uniref:CRISPR-associated protein Csb2 n=1 Tax=Rhodococcus triatomae TaxID=300028 RepID=A0A1G8IYM0_9NOCA|nr:type I-U CRISPR-associated protein Csb2 [Rhodococcus triatomae]QNG19864.1 type I-U CRISPR-associated protein Cas5/Cas6 [Rhodococcus triatomae]QNG24220.1 type I-U CRISPR-associated protein Cas5/Cas6 [Rhodococcus triatomae]SDI24155.1 CRISPR-associated protein Csb2 [Rhodococcus triatomae]